jgi:uncharacterized protein with predicted RNA binding PUA domain
MDLRDKFAMSIDYLFGYEVSSVLPLENLSFSISKRTGKIKDVLINSDRIASLRSDGSIAITIKGAQILRRQEIFNDNCVTVQKGPDEFISKGKSVFAKHVVNCGNKVRPGCDVAVIDLNGIIIAVGKALLSAKMMKAFNRGIAVKVRESLIKDVRKM